MNYKYIFFDLDGTLTDSKEGIVKSAQYALHSLGIDEPDLTKLEVFLGPPLTTSFEEFYHFDEKTVEKAVKKYRERYSVTGIFENKDYDGIKQLLSHLQERGYKLVVATSKPETFAKKILVKYDLDKYFITCSGSGLYMEKETKADIINKALKRLNITNKSEVIMIGDRKHDVIGAKECGIKVIGVKYGYSKGNELEEAGADFIVNTIEDLDKFFK